MRLTTIPTLLVLLTAMLTFNQCSILMPAGSSGQTNRPRPVQPTPPVVDRPPTPPDSNPANQPPTEVTEDPTTPVEEPFSAGSSLSARERAFRRNIVDYAMRFKGSKYVYAGRDPKTGFDCSGFTYYVLKNFDVILSPSSRAQENQGRKVRIDRVNPGDLIFYRRSPGTNVFHVSLVVANDPDGIKVIHSTSRGVVVDNISTSSYWSPKISTARDVISGKN